MIRYVLQTTALLKARGVKLLVIACNTATGVSLEALQEAYPELPVVGVIRPGAEAACRSSRSGKIGVIGTESTINARGYEREILRIRPDAKVFAQPCPLFVPLPKRDGAKARSLILWLSATSGPWSETRVLTLWFWAVLISLSWPARSRAWWETTCAGRLARTTAEFVQEMLERRDICSTTTDRSLTFLATDGARRFARVGGVFMHIRWTLQTWRSWISDVRLAGRGRRGAYGSGSSGP